MRTAHAVALVAAAIVLVSVLAALLGGGALEADGSSLSRGAEGWLAARRYLQAAGTPVAVLDRRLRDAVDLQGVLVTTFPWQRRIPEEPLDGLDGYLRRGGTVLLGFTGAAPDAAESKVLEDLGMPAQEVGPPPPLGPIAWWRYVRQESRLRPAADAFARPPAELVCATPRFLPRAPAGARVLLRGEGERPAAFAFRRGAGRVVALPAELFANARLGRPGHAELLEALRRGLGGRWTFDEYHHGLTAAGAVGSETSRRAFDAYLLHLAFVYALAVLALSRRFGPVWSEPAVIGSSTRAFLVGLGALHHRLGHHAEAARRLLGRARELDPHLAVPPDLARSAQAAADAAGLVALARRLAGLQNRGGAHR